MSEQASAEQEQGFHQYESSHIPWYVHAMWIVFWLFVASYVASFLIPAPKIELVTPP